MGWDWDGFDWDEGNSTKNWDKHQVTKSECEEAFFNRPIVLLESHQMDLKEPRYVLLSQSNQNRLLTIVFTKRLTKVRVISARDMSKKERRLYVETHSQI